jgi:hypothetical protein
METSDATAGRTATGLRALADLFERFPHLLDTGHLRIGIHPGPARLDAWADALREFGVPFTDRNDDHSREIISGDLAGLRAVSVHDEPYRRYLREQEFVRAHRDEIHAEVSA